MSSSKVVIRRAEGPEDIALIRQLFANYGAYLAANPTGAANMCIQDFQRELDSLPGPYAPPAGVLLLALLDGVAVGCCALKPIRPAAPHDPNQAAIELKRLWVEPVARGRHLGRLLAEAAIAHAEVLGCTAIYLDTVPAAMPEANLLYRRLGFEPIERYNSNTVESVAFFRRQLHQNGPST